MVFSKKWRILVVDDEDVLREILAKAIVMWGGEALVASNGREALKILETEKVDLVLSDVRMPGGDGVELLENIKKRNTENPIVIMMSGYTDMSREAMLQRGAYDLFNKPFPLKKISDVLKNILG